MDTTMSDGQKFREKVSQKTDVNPAMSIDSNLDPSGQVQDSTIGTIRGDLTFTDQVIQKIIGIALHDVDGLLRVTGGFFSNLTEKLINSEHPTTGIDVEVGKKQVAVDLDVVVEYQKSIPTLFKEMKDVIQAEVHKMTDLDVVELNVHVVDVQTKTEYAHNSDTMKNKLDNATEKAKHLINKGKEKVADLNTETADPRVE